jgi:hypothetical protein
MDKVLFQEEEKFREWWRTLLVLAGTIPAIISLVYSFFKLGGNNDPFNRSTMPTIISVMLFVFLLSTIWVYFSCKLELWIDQKGIHYRFFPLIYRIKFISKEEIQRFEIRKYSAVFDYGGRGFRRGFGRKWGRALTISGNMGLQLYLTNGKKVLFGTQRSQAILYAMEEMIKHK